jgi:hypothetical protein
MRALVLALVVSGACGVVATVMSSCSSTEPTASTSQALDSGALGSVSSHAFSPSAVVSGPNIVVGWTSNAAAPSSAVRWAYSVDDETWTPCDVGNIPTGCNGGNTPFAGTQTTWLGQGAMAADGQGNVVYVVLGRRGNPRHCGLRRSSRNTHYARFRGSRPAKSDLRTKGGPLRASRGTHRVGSSPPLARCGRVIAPAEVAEKSTKTPPTIHRAT